jgi:hypothetical protein
LKENPVTVFFTVSYIANIGVLWLAVTRPTASWLAADRNRSFWLVLIAFFGITGVLGLFADVAFLIGVLPRMRTAGANDPNRLGDASRQANPFSKH